MPPAPERAIRRRAQRRGGLPVRAAAALGSVVLALGLSGCLLEDNADDAGSKEHESAAHRHAPGGGHRHLPAPTGKVRGPLAACLRVKVGPVVRSSLSEGQDPLLLRVRTIRGPEVNVYVFSREADAVRYMSSPSVLPRARRGGRVANFSPDTTRPVRRRVVGCFEKHPPSAP